MRLAALSDIHGNLPALEAVLDDIARSQVDLSVNLGDIVSGPLWPAETAACLLALGLPTLRGNHERQLAMAEPPTASDRFAATALSGAQRDWLASLPPTLQLADDVFCCHGTPDSDLVYLLETVTGGWVRGAGSGVRAASEAELATRVGDTLRGQPQALILCGHSHRPRALALGDGRLVVNPGSVGLQAYDEARPAPHVIENGTPHARYALLTRRAAGWQVELRAVPYAHETAARRAELHGRGDWVDALRTGRVGRLEEDPG